MIWARSAGVMGMPMKWEIARIFVVGTGGSGFCAEAAPSGVIGFFMAVAPYLGRGREIAAFIAPRDAPEVSQFPQDRPNPSSHVPSAVWAGRSSQDLRTPVALREPLIHERNGLDFRPSRSAACPLP